MRKLPTPQRILWLVLFMVFVTNHSQCQTFNEKSQTQKLFVQTFGGLPRPTLGTLVCTVNRNDIRVRENLVLWDSLIAKIAKVPTSVAMHIMARTPSLEISVYRKSKNITLLKDHQTREFRPIGAAKTLATMIEKLCPQPKKEK